MTQEASARFAADPRSAGQARGFVAATLDEWALGAMVDSAVLLVSEVVSNAVLHAGSPIEARLRVRDGVLRIEVSDDSPVPPRLRRFAVDSATGRGLRLLDAVAGRWGVEPDRRPGRGKTVWFEMPATPGHDDLSGWHEFDADTVDAL